jgi:hypothetical protein
MLIESFNNSSNIDRRDDVIRLTQPSIVHPTYDLKDPQECLAFQHHQMAMLTGFASSED